MNTCGKLFVIPCSNQQAMCRHVGKRCNIDFYETFAAATASTFTNNIDQIHRILLTMKTVVFGTPNVTFI